MNNHFVLEGELFKLRLITMDDTHYIIKWRNNPNVSNQFLFRKKFTRHIHENWMKTKVKNKEVLQYIIIDKKTNNPIGSVYIRDINYETMSGEYGIFIGEDDYRGKGYGSEIAKLFVEFCFNKLHFHKIYLKVLEENKSAYRTYQKAGFKKEALFKDFIKINDEYCNVYFMSIINGKDTN